MRFTRRPVSGSSPGCLSRSMMRGARSQWSSRSLAFFPAAHVDALPSPRIDHVTVAGLRVGFVGGVEDRAEQVVDGLVRGRHHADRLATRHQIDGDPRARPRLAGAGRALDHECAVGKPAHLRAQALEVERLVGERRRGRS